MKNTNNAFSPIKLEIYNNGLHSTKILFPLLMPVGFPYPLSLTFLKKEDVLLLCLFVL